MTLSAPVAARSDVVALVAKAAEVGLHAEEALALAMAMQTSPTPRTPADAIKVSIKALGNIRNPQVVRPSPHLYPSVISPDIGTDSLAARTMSAVYSPARLPSAGEFTAAIAGRTQLTPAERALAAWVTTHLDPAGSHQIPLFAVGAVLATSARLAIVDADNQPYGFGDVPATTEGLRRIADILVGNPDQGEAVAALGEVELTEGFDIGPLNDRIEAMRASDPAAGQAPPTMPML